MEDLPSHHHHHQGGGISPHPVNSYDGMDHVHGHGLGDEHLIHHDHGHGEGHHKRGISPLPINSYGGNGHGDGHMIHHHHHGPHGLNGPPILGHEAQELQPYNEKKVVIRYKECLKNHAATMGGNARDGCGEFMPNGEEGTLESLICSACNCHRNFHRKEIEGHTYLPPLLTHRPTGLTRVGSLGYPAPSGAPAPPQQQMRVPYNYNISESDPSYHHHHHHHHVVQKRFRTKFSQEQKEKMLNFAEKIGWRLQKQEEGVVQQFCQEIGVKRRVLKVWMHNNKHNLAKKNNPPTAT